MELITDDEDRLLLTSLGHWTGDAVWNPGPNPPFYATAELILPTAAPSKKMRLSYPNIKVVPGNIHYLYFNFIDWNWNDDKTCIARLTDGVQIIERTETLPEWEHWIWVMEAITIPPGWIKAGTFLEIEASGIPTRDIVLEFTNFSFNAFPPQAPQYLPLMGIG